MKPLLHVFRFSLLVVVLFMWNTHSDWIQMNGPWGGNIISMAKIGNTLFAGSPKGAFFSVDEATTWTEASGLAGRVVLSFAGIGSDFFAGTGDGVYHSTDNGANWTPAGEGMPAGITIMALEASDCMLIAGSDSGIYISIDTGRTWSAASSGLTSMRVNCCAVNNGIFYAGTYGGLFHSSDGGATWSSTASGFSGKFIRCLKVAGDRLYVSINESGMLRSIDNGSEWTPINTGLPDNASLSFAADGDNLICGANGPAYISHDAGDSWNLLNSDVCTHFSSGVIYGNTIIVGSYFGAFRSYDNGASWTKAKDGITYSTAMSLVSSSANVIAGMMIHGIAVSGDDGATWNEFDMDFYYTNVQSLAVNGTSVFAGIEILGAFVSTNGGASWAPLNGTVDHISHRFLGVHDGVLFAQISDTLSRSTDNGASWTAIPSDFQISSFTGSGTALFGGSGFMSVYRSVDNGDSWSLFKSGGGEHEYVNDLIVVADTVVAGSTTGIYRSVGENATWTPVKSNSKLINCFAKGGEAIFAGTDSGVLLSTDNGKSWTKVNEGLSECSVQSLTMHGDLLFAGTSQGGIWRRPIVEMTDPLRVRLRVANLEKNDITIVAPHPINAYTTILVSLATSGWTTLTLTDISGKKVASLVDAKCTAGRYCYHWNTRNVAPGCYYLMMRTQTGTLVKTVPVLR